MSTRAQKKQEQEEALKHLLDNVLEENLDSPLQKSLKELGFDNINDIVTMKEDEIMDL